MVLRLNELRTSYADATIDAFLITQWAGIMDPSLGDDTMNASERVSSRGVGGLFLFVQLP